MVKYWHSDQSQGEMKLLVIYRHQPKHKDT